MDNKKSNIGLVIALIIFVILSIVLGICLFYDKLNNNSIKTTTQTDNTAKNTNDDFDKTDTKSNVSVVDFYFNSVAIVNDDSVYVNVLGTEQEIDDLFGKGTYQTLMTTRKGYKEYTFNNFEYISNDNSSFIGMKLNANNVKKVYSYAHGQMLLSNYGLILLNNDKTLSIISLYSLINGKTEVKNISGLSNIESIITENDGGMITYAINQSGEKIDLSSYIPSDYKSF